VNGREVRILHYRRYRIAYVIHQDTGDIDILEVFHGALPIERYTFSVSYSAMIAFQCRIMIPMSA
jgi:hypothetical protein